MSYCIKWNNFEKMYNNFNFINCLYNVNIYKLFLILNKYIINNVLKLE